MAQLTIQHGPTERTIAVTPDLPLLDQILAQGVDLPYSCRRGDCGLCAVSLTAGNLAPHEPAQAFRRHDDYLLCNCRLATDAPASIARPWFPELAGIAARRSPGDEAGRQAGSRSMNLPAASPNSLTGKSKKVFITDGTRLIGSHLRSAHERHVSSNSERAA